MRVFLGGTWNGSPWRSVMTRRFRARGIEYSDPIVDDRNEEAQANELREREECDFCLYTITPLMIGVYSIAEVVDDSNKRPEKTILLLLRDDAIGEFSDSQWKSLQAVAKLVTRNGAKAFTNLIAAADYIGEN
jgi:hypothetical protein